MIIEYVLCDSVLKLYGHEAKIELYMFANNVEMKLKLHRLTLGKDCKGEN